ncbi:unnamed protein product [Oppiella nova]|uniref:Uncharacterized protein n=1 Tax=Oppiella nova TaxID=334625 RepID=A0A7R9LZW5_9ACAR|nr:unnamed protein product [Oppiella nova]CAG2168527.1 unnamed protein product [Oppiella nova]
MKSDHLPIDESISLANEVFEDVMKSNDVVKGLATIEPYCDRSVYHSLVRSLYLLLTAGTSMEKVDIDAAQIAVNDLRDVCNKHRKTVEVHAELVHALSLAISVVVEIIMRTRSHWESETSRLNFESTVRCCNGICHLVISNIPPKILRIINFLGIRGVESLGWKNINKAAFELPDMARARERP